MGSVGLSFGSPTSGQGFDVTTTVNEIVGNLQAVETPWKNQLTTLGSQDTALTSIGTDLSSLSTALQALTDFEGVLSEKEGSSSDTSILDLTGADTSAVAGSHTVVVNSLAQTDSWYSDDVVSTDTLSGSLTINGKAIQISNGTATDSNGKTIPANNTLATLKSYINSGSYGVTANLVTDSGGERLSLVSNTSGKGGDITLKASGLKDSTSGSSVNFTEAQQGTLVGGQDASFSVDGINMTSPSNTVTTAIQGVTLQLLSADPNTSVQVEVANDTTDVETAVSNFVNAYNTVVKDVNTQEGKDSSGNPEPLYGNPTLAMLQTQMDEALNFVQSSGAITSATQLGIEASASDDGTLTLNTNTLDSALNSNYQDVVNLFQPASGFTSFGDNFSTTLGNLANSAPSGAIYMTLQQNSTQESQLNTNITNQNTLIGTQQANLTSELNQANQTLQEIPMELQEINEMYGAMTGYGENPQG
ncbi:MAG TPA: flagellar filament capping protein FliD [Acidobacteriaceae bacterium]